MGPPRTLYLVHHSHTDIGYTDTQARIEFAHVDFIRQAIHIAERRPAFRWVCETFWPVERFWARASPGEKDAFARLLRSGNLGLSGSYLNFSELIGEDVLRAVTARAGRFAAALGCRVESAMTADVNGYSWGFSQALFDAGIRNLFTCIHTHHGHYPLGEQQIGFWWETPGGERLLVWSGEHYHFGNELGLAPGAVSSYLTKDECDAAMIHGDYWRVAEIRIPRYLERLAGRGYPFDFAPLMVSGLRSDNAPPSAAVLDCVERWNDRHGGTVRIEMANLDDFFARLRTEADGLAVHRGDWPDWWSDGPASRPAAVRVYRQAQRDYDMLRRLGDEPAESVETDLALFAEHTFSHSDSMARPWDPMVAAIHAGKNAYAARAGAVVAERLDALLAGRGATPLRPAMPLRYKVLNPHDRALAGVARLRVGHFEFHELGLDRGFAVGEHPCELGHVAGGAEICVPLRLDTGEERVLEVEAVANGRGAGVESQPGPMETPFVRIEWGPSRWTDLLSGNSLLRAGHPHGPFQPVYEVTPVPTRDAICAVRGAMGLNRKGPDARRSVGAFRGVRSARSGEVFESATLAWDVDGAGFFEVELRAHRHAPRVDAIVRLHKLSVWEPENLYVALPFGDRTVWLDKAGAHVRPRVDQIPGTLTDFYAVSAGIAFRGLGLAMPDQHLLQMGPLEHGERLLAGDPRLEHDPGHLYAWLMTNYWETNFDADLGGFHQFRYSLLWGAGLEDPAEVLRACRNTSLGLVAFRLREGAE